MRNILFIAVIAAFFTACCNNQPAGQTGNSYIRSGETWYDTDGVPIEAHAGGILFRDGLFYWYGEHHAEGFYNKTGICCYSSADLVNWKNEGVVLPRDSFPVKYRAYSEGEAVPKGCPNDGVAERPKVIYNEATGKYVMWIHMDANGYTEAEAGVAVSDSPTGPFRYLKSFRPVKYEYPGMDEWANKDLLKERERGNTYRDMALFVDDDKKGYVIYASETNATLYIVRLNDDYTDVEKPLVKGKNWDRALSYGNREAPAPFKHKGKYYMITSGLTGWTPNPAEYHVADNMLGPWTTLGDPCVGPNSHTTFFSQSTYVLPVAGKPEGSFIFMADRWDGYQLENSRFVWLPFVMGETSEIRLEYFSEWNWDVFDQSPEALVAPQVRVKETEGAKTLHWQAVKGANAYRIFQNGEYKGVTSNTEHRIETELAGKGFNFSVTAIRLNGESSMHSNAVTVVWNKPGNLYLSDIKPDKHTQHWGFPRFDRSLENGPLAIGDEAFEKGLGLHAPSETVYHLCGNYSRLTGACGIDVFPRLQKVSSAVFRIIGDGKILFDSGIMRNETPAARFDVDVTGVSELKLVTTDGGDDPNWDHVNWVGLKLEK